MTGRLALAAAALVCATAPWAQEIRPLDERVANAPGYYFYVLPGEVSTQVSILGTVRAPGFYTLSDGIDLGEALALAGGPLVASQNAEVERIVTIRLYRGEGARELVYESTLDGFARDASAHPRLADGDLIEVATTERRLRTFRDTLALVGAVSTVVIAAIQVIDLLAR